MNTKAPFGIALVVMASACTPFEKAEPPGDGLFAPIHARDLVEFDRTIRTHTARNERKPWLGVASGWLSLVNCTPIEASESTNPLARWIQRSISLEVSRRDVTLSKSGAAGLKGTVFATLYRSAYFERAPEDPNTGAVRWPGEGEVWPDELPAPRAVPSSCPNLVASLSEQNPGGTTDPSELSRRLNATIQAMETTNADPQGAVAEVRASTYGFAAQLAYELAQDTDTPSAALNESLQFAQLATDAPMGQLEPTYQAQLHFLRAVLEEAVGTPELALVHVQKARELGLDTTNRWGASYLDVRLQQRLATWNASPPDLPPPGSRWYGPSVYRLVDRFRDDPQGYFDFVLQALRPRGSANDPFLQVVENDFMAKLCSAFAFDARTVEMLEDIGPRNQTYDRVERFARVCLRDGQPEAAKQAVSYVLDQNPNGSRRSAYIGLLAVAAFQSNNLPQFRTQMKALLARQTEGRVPRRAVFGQAADRELADILRWMIPDMAGWAEDPRTRKLQQTWLSEVIRVTQDHLRNSRATPERAALEAGYRTASQLLKDHPRGWVEHIGDQSPLILGAVDGPGPDLTKAEPDVVVSLSQPYSLALVPVDNADTAQWRRVWPEVSP